MHVKKFQQGILKSKQTSSRSLLNYYYYRATTPGGIKICTAQALKAETLR